MSNLRPERAAARVARFAAALATAVLMAGCGSAPSDTPEHERIAPDSGEILIGSAPAGWMEAGGLNRGTLRIAEYANPATLTPDLVDTARFESQATLPLPDPIDFVLGASAELAARCQGFEDHPVFAGYENGYPTAVRLMFCRRHGDPSRGEVRMVKAIQGKEQFYIVSRSRMTAPLEPDVVPLDAAEMAAWSEWFGGITLCDTRLPAHPCPATVTTAPAEEPAEEPAIQE